MSSFDAAQEFDRQLQTLRHLGYPSIDESAAHLRAQAIAHRAASEPTRSRLPFLLVVKQGRVELTTLDGKPKPGRIDRNYKEGELATFVPRKELDVPEPPAYLVFDIERGEEFCNVRPQEATATIFGRGRTPLTIDEGIAMITQFPATLEKNKCFMLAGSRAEGSRKVPALWISEGAPKLGWCWDGNPHTWLGTASCAGRAA